ncbi:MAG: DUF1304 domain-containing protein [Microbacterium ginsengisoli]|mgnify:CR=1 FL=1|jgi:putative membrane protein|uniref:DUF1304 domain-containing protein n=1 Tax=Microbacterium TaxID=33882 RepID=UPI0006F3E1C0|nr:MULTISPECIES: DUF1304 domain-containing protein [unclassified Microbacterium]MBN9199551.1 DUF1304 domain-containing protein [Microbacterium ginsengisoli]KQR94254.1 epimerase [Microbacterium sp. Leaf351]KQS02511.1 epimerase [Microbacterium sp. Leaf347]MBN9207459.1 DUF1304 domain-containing protein [Microbacterium ginsengisoli]ODU76624.1 MAG: epimerase [Microbacterium sp. SCN 71-21]
MIIAALVFAALAALVHVYIFVLESLRWTEPATRRIFGLRSAEEAELTRSLAFNQGFYNLFLALATAIGIVLVATGSLTIGATLVLVGTGSMLAAALVLVLSSPKLARSAAIQGTFPLIAVVLTALALI